MSRMVVLAKKKFQASALAECKFELAKLSDLLRRGTQLNREAVMGLGHTPLSAAPCIAAPGPILLAILLKRSMVIGVVIVGLCRDNGK